MANLTIYLPDALRRQVKRAGLPASRICQQALQDELATRQRVRAGRNNAARNTTTTKERRHDKHQH